MDSNGSYHFRLSSWPNCVMRIRQQTLNKDDVSHTAFSQAWAACKFTAAEWLLTWLPLSQLVSVLSRFGKQRCGVRDAPPVNIKSTRSETRSPKVNVSARRPASFQVVPFWMLSFVDMLQVDGGLKLPFGRLQLLAGMFSLSPRENIQQISQVHSLHIQSWPSTGWDALGASNIFSNMNIMFRWTKNTFCCWFSDGLSQSQVVLRFLFCFSFDWPMPPGRLSNWIVCTHGPRDWLAATLLRQCSEARKNNRFEFQTSWKRERNKTPHWSISAAMCFLSSHCNIAMMCKGTNIFLLEATSLPFVVFVS